jgi:hypothetical protein
MSRTGVRYSKDYVKLFAPHKENIFFPRVRGKMVAHFPKERARDAVATAKKLEARHKRRDEYGKEFHEALSSRYMSLMDTRLRMEQEESAKIQKAINELSDEDLIRLLAETGLADDPAVEEEE